VSKRTPWTCTTQWGVLRAHSKWMHWAGLVCSLGQTVNIFILHLPTRDTLYMVITVQASWVELLHTPLLHISSSQGTWLVCIRNWFHTRSASASVTQGSRAACYLLGHRCWCCECE
jgi:hypothetical protein